jgi:hypothetical protein
VDILTLKKAEKYAKALIDTLGEDVTELGEDVEELGDDLLIVNADGDTACKVIINALRQHIWKSEDEAPVCEEGTVTLTNSRKFPFNNSKKTVALVKRQRDTKYTVVAEVTTVAGNIGDIRISDKAVNGYKMEYSGGAASCSVKYYVIGGIVK